MASMDACSRYSLKALMAAAMPRVLVFAIRKRWISMNSEEWMFGCQVTNQSVENGSMPLGGDTPLTSLYNRSRRSRLSEVSTSRTWNTTSLARVG